MELIPEQSLAETMQTAVEPYLAGLCTKGKLNSGLYYEYFQLPAAKGTVVISHGFTEASVKFHELIYYLLRAGFDCAVLDHRGHGFSVRETAEKNLVHITDFEQYVRDLHELVHTVVVPGTAPMYLYGHSMGGCIAARYLEAYPADFKKAVLNAPMLGLQTGGLPEWLCLAIFSVPILLGRGDRRVFFHGEFQPDPPFETDCATSRARFDYYQSLRRQEPALQTSAASYSWAREAIRAGRRALAEADQIQAPVLLFQAETDTLVTAQAQADFIRRVKNGRLVRVPGSKHEIYRSENTVLAGYWKELLSFLAAD